MKLAQAKVAHPAAMREILRQRAERERAASVRIILVVAEAVQVDGRDMLRVCAMADASPDGSGDPAPLMFEAPLEPEVQLHPEAPGDAPHVVH
jgi:hypothetical protein